MKKSSQKFIYKIVLSIFIFCIALYFINPKQILSSLKELSLKSIIFSYAFIILSFICFSIRWYYILRWQSIKPRFFPIVTTAMRGFFFNTFIPGNLGNDIYRFKGALPYGAGKLTTVSLLAQERFMGLASFLFFYILCFILCGEDIQTTHEIQSILAWCVAGLVILFILYCFCRPLLSIVKAHFQNKKIINFFTTIVESRLPLYAKDSILVFLLTFLGLFLFFASFYMLASELSSNVSFILLCMGLIVVEIVRFLPITVQGIGLREGCLAWFFYVSGLPAAEGFTIAILGYALLTLGQIGMYGLSYVFDLLQWHE